MDLPANIDANGALKAAITTAAKSFACYGERWDFMLGCRFGLRERERDEPFSEYALGRNSTAWRKGRDLTLNFTGV